MKPTDKTLKLLLDYEVGGGEKYYNKYLSKFTWPGGASGPTIGIGIDCAYYTEKELENIFKFLSKEDLDMVKKSIGKTGDSGKEYTKTLRNSEIEVSWENALTIFKQITWPKFSKLAEKAFPGLSELCPDAYGAIVSLVFNRGVSMKGDSRTEMRNIKNFVLKKDYRNISKEIRKMKRIWKGKNLDGLIARREQEALLVESCV
jgi:GH24 family phage-related lysozyme (muramidase)